MRENRPYGSEGGESGLAGLSYPYLYYAIAVGSEFAPCQQWVGTAKNDEDERSLSSSFPRDAEQWSLQFSEFQERRT